MNITCQLLSHSNGPHVQQAYAGFLMLQRRGLIDLEQRFSGEQIIFPSRVRYLRDARRAHLSVLVNGLRLHYDAHDSWEVDEPFLEASDFYFKRSFSAAHLRQFGARDKIHPLGLYYNVYPDGVDWRGLRRSAAFLNRNNWRQLARPLDPFNKFGFTPRVSIVESLPHHALSDEPPKVLFMARTWDPYDVPDRSPEKVAEFHEINEMRAACIRALKEAFGERFYGGFMHKPYAQKHYPDALMPDPSIATKANYLKLLRGYSVCIATAGLLGSNGGKLGEYVASSKAIVTEKLNYGVPGGFSEEQNYLSFDSPEQCVAQVRRLFEDDALRRAMMTNNARYYQGYLKPDALILNTLLTALSGQTYDWSTVEASAVRS